MRTYLLPVPAGLITTGTVTSTYWFSTTWIGRTKRRPIAAGKNPAIVLTAIRRIIQGSHPPSIATKEMEHSETSLERQSCKMAKVRDWAWFLLILTTMDGPISSLLTMGSAISIIEIMGMARLRI